MRSSRQGRPRERVQTGHAHLMTYAKSVAMAAIATSARSRHQVVSRLRRIPLPRAATLRGSFMRRSPSTDDNGDGYFAAKTCSGDPMTAVQEAKRAIGTLNGEDGRSGRFH